MARTMKGVVKEAVGSPYKVVEDLEVPEPGEGKLLAKSIATAINPVCAFSFLPFLTAGPRSSLPFNPLSSPVGRPCFHHPLRLPSYSLPPHRENVLHAPSKTYMSTSDLLIKSFPSSLVVTLPASSPSPGPTLPSMPANASAVAPASAFSATLPFNDTSSCMSASPFSHLPA